MTDLQWFLYISVFVVFMIGVVLVVWWFISHRRQDSYSVVDGRRIPMSPSTLASMDAYCVARQAQQSAK